MDLLDTPAEEAFDRLTRLASRALDVPVALVTLVDEERQFFKSQCGLPEPWAARRETPLSHSFCQHVVGSGEPLIVQDAREHPLVRDNPAVRDLDVIAYAGFPLRLGDGQVLGAFCAIDHHSREWTEDERMVLSDLAATASAEIEWRVAREGDLRFRTLAETASEAIFTMDAESVILSANPAVEQIFGYHSSELVGQPLSILIPERFREAHAAGVRRYLQTGRRNIPWKGVELPGLTRDGDEIPLEISFGEYVHDGKHVFTGFIRDIRERKRADEEREFLAEATRVLSSSLDYETTLASVARLSVLRIADWCGVDLLENGGIHRVATAHADPRMEAVARELRRYPFNADAPGGAPLAIRTGQPALYPEISDALLEAVARDPEHQRLLRTLGMRSAMVVPLIARGQTLGAISLVSAESGRSYEPRDLALAEELARQAAIAVDHARLYREAGEARVSVEHQAAELELQMEELQEQSVQLEEHQVELEMANADLQRVNAELGAAEASYRSLFDSLTELVYIQDLEGRFVAVNEAVLRRYGRSREEILGRTADLLMDPTRTDMSAVHTRFRHAAQGEVQRFELWGRTRAGESFPKEITLSPGRHFGRDVVIAVGRDITDRLRAEEERRESEKREQLIRVMEIERSRLNSLFQQAPAFIAILRGPDHVFDVTNAQYDQLIGHREVLGKPVREALPEMEAQGFLELLDRVYQTSEPHVGRGTRVLLQREEGADLEERYINFIYQPLLGPQGEVSGIFVHGVDVSDIVRAREEAEAANRAKSDFLSRMSHELRTPLNAILGFGQLLEMDADTEENRESVDQILKAGKHLLGLVDEVLDIARIEAGQMSLSVEPVSVPSVLRESVDLVRPAAVKQRITLREQDALPVEHFVAADQQRLKQVLLNLLSNAIKYNRREGTISLSCEKAGEDRLRISVRDTGYGIPAGKLERLFTPFDRLGADQTAVEGTGLGLALSKGLVEAMGGTLGVESVEEEGSRFWVELPLVPRPIVVESTPTERPAEIPREVAGSTHTVLFVEDNLANVRLMERIFRRRPYVRLLTAMQGGLGLELAREHRPDLILLDLNLPDLSGDKVLLQVRQDPALRHIPVVMISGDAIPSQVQRLLDLGARGYVTKPFDIPEFLRVVDENLRQEER